MNRKRIISIATGTVLGISILAAANVAQYFNMGNMMNPGEWFDDDDDYYRYGRGGYYGGGPYGWGGPYGGYGPYGYPGGYGQPSTIVVNPSSGANQPPPPRLPE